MRSTLTIMCIYILQGCGTEAPATVPTEMVLVEAMQEAVTWPNPSLQLVVNLLNRYNALERHAEGHRFFEARAAATVGEPEHPWMLAASGLFRVQSNGDIPLLQRVAWVEQGIAELDAAVDLDGGFPRYLRGLVLCQLPDRFDERTRGIDDLEWVLEQGDAFPPGIARGALRALADAYAIEGATEDAEAAAAASGHSFAPGEGTLATDFSVTRAEGFRFGTPRILPIADRVWVAQAYDFGDIGFVETPDGLVVIDAGTFPDQATHALEGVREFTSAAIRTLVLTHGHWDHIGGAAAYVGDGVEVVAESHFEEEIETVRAVDPPPYRWFFGARSVPLDVQPTRFVAEPTELGLSRRVDVLPVKGGETHDALLVHVPDAGVVFTGDAFMPYLGAPFAEEGDPEELLTTIDRILELQPQVLVHGHPPLTALYTIEVMPTLRDALGELVQHTIAAIRDARPLHAALRDNLLPDGLAANPDAVLPYLVMREGIIKRLYDRRTGYWQSDREGVEIFAPEDWARALDVLGGGEQAYARAVETLLEGGEAAMPLRIADIALVSHPDSERLKALRMRALQRLRTLHHQSNPFKLIVYSEEADAELLPL